MPSDSAVYPFLGQNVEWPGKKNRTKINENWTEQKWPEKTRRTIIIATNFIWKQLLAKSWANSGVTANYTKQKLIQRQITHFRFKSADAKTIFPVKKNIKENQFSS